MIQSNLLQVGDLLRSFSLLVFKQDKKEELSLVRIVCVYIYYHVWRCIAASADYHIMNCIPITTLTTILTSAILNTSHVTYLFVDRHGYQFEPSNDDGN